MKSVARKHVTALLILIVLMHIVSLLTFLIVLSAGRYGYHVDNLWRSVLAYKWSLNPFFTWDPAKLPLEYALYGSLLRVWPDLTAALPVMNIFLSSATINIF